MLYKYSETMTRTHTKRHKTYLIRIASSGPIDLAAAAISYNGTIRNVLHSDCVNLGSQIPIFSTGLIAKSADSISKFSAKEGQTKRYLHNITKGNDENWKQPRGKWQ